MSCHEHNWFPLHSCCLVTLAIKVIVTGIPSQIEIVLGKSAKFDELMAAAAEEREAAEAEEQS